MRTTADSFLRGLPLILIVVLAGLPGCPHRREPVDLPRPVGAGKVALEHIPPPEREDPGAREDHRKVIYEASPETLSEKPPEYPASALEDRVACSARLLYHVEMDGTATLVRLEWEVAPPADHLEAFERTIADAVTRWKYVPAHQMRYRMGEDGIEVFEKHPIPKARHARIRFRVEEGRGIVE